MGNNWDGDAVQCNCDCDGYDVVESVENGNCDDGVDNDCNGAIDDCYECDLLTAVITADCGDNGCEEGEMVSMSGTYSGECLDADFFQIDALSGDSTCDVQYMDGDMSGVWADTIAIDNGEIFGSWTVGSITDDCVGQTVIATAAALYTGGAPGTGDQIAYSGSPSGSITFWEPDVGDMFTLEMKKGWNLMSVPFKTVTGYQEDTCGAANAKYYWLDDNGKWVVDTVGVRNIVGGKGYYYHAVKDCGITVFGTESSMATDITLTIGWTQVGSPRNGLTNLNYISDAASNCNYLWWNPESNSWEEKIALEEGKGYRVEC